MIPYDVTIRLSLYKMTHCLAIPFYLAKHNTFRLRACEKHIYNSTHHRAILALRKEKQNTGSDGLIFVGRPAAPPALSLARPAEAELDTWFERKSDQVPWEKNWGDPLIK